MEDGWKPALAKEERKWPYILEHGEPPPDDPQLTPEDGWTLAHLCNEFLNSKLRALESGELTPEPLKIIARPPIG